MASFLSEKTVQPSVNPDHLSTCPTMDLVALATIDQKLNVFRLNGQEVLNLKDRHPGSHIDAIAWKPDGVYAISGLRCPA